MLNAYPFLEGKQNRRKIDTFRQIAKTTGKQIEYSGNLLLFFLQGENNLLAPDLLHKKIWGKCFKIHSIKCGGKSQTIERIVFLNETLFDGLLFHCETARQ